MIRKGNFLTLAQPFNYIKKQETYMNIILGLISAYITICIVLCLTYLIPHTIPQNLARSLEDAPKNRIVNVEIGDNDLSYVKIKHKSIIRKLENNSSLQQIETL